MLKQSLTSLLLALLLFIPLHSFSENKPDKQPKWTECTEPRPQLCTQEYMPVCATHQDGSSVIVQQDLSPGYTAEVNFIREQLTGDTQSEPVHRWIRLPDNTLRCMTQFNSVGRGRAQVHALICVDAEMVLG